MDTTTLMTMLLIGVVLVSFGGMVLNRLPQPKVEAKLWYEECEYYVAFKIETVIEEAFEVAFVDRWHIGRSFSISGPTVRYEYDEGPNPPKITKVGLKILPTPNWFEETRIGGIRFYDSGGVQGSIRLPYQIAQNLLEEIRRNADQLVVLGYKETAREGGKRVDPIYSFELQEPLD